MRRRLLPVLVAAAVLPLSACTGGSADSGVEPPPSDAGTTAPATPAASVGTTTPAASPTPATESCLEGRYQVKRFVATRSQAFGTGEGGDVEVTFDGGEYTLTGDGDQALTVTLAGQQAELRVDGSVSGRYSPLQGGRTEFTLGSSEGKATIAAAGQSRSLTMKDVAQVIAPRGDATVTCAEPALTITLTEVRLELERV